VLFVLFEPALFGGAECFLRETTGLTAYVRGCPPAPGVERITLPGDPERITRQKRSADGIPVPDGTWELLVKEAVALGVPVP
jgi:hydroxycarboxylate dehydrogenase B